jgi:hypothetical protein
LAQDRIIQHLYHSDVCTIDVIAQQVNILHLRLTPADSNIPKNYALKLEHVINESCLALYEKEKIFQDLNTEV